MAVGLELVRHVEQHGSRRIAADAQGVEKICDKTDAGRDRKAAIAKVFAIAINVADKEDEIVDEQDAQEAEQSFDHLNTPFWRLRLGTAAFCRAMRRARTHF